MSSRCRFLLPVSCIHFRLHHSPVMATVFITLSEYVLLQMHLPGIRRISDEWYIFKQPYIRAYATLSCSCDHRVTGERHRNSLYHKCGWPPNLTVLQKMHPTRVTDLDEIKTLNKNSMGQAGSRRRHCYSFGVFGVVLWRLWRRPVSACINASDGHFEHCLQWWAVVNYFVVNCVVKILQSSWVGKSNYFKVIGIVDR